MKSKSYLKLLKDPQWQKKRLEIMQRDDWTCQVCGAKDKTLNVHHKDYITGRKPWEYNDDYLITLCQKCHKDIEYNQKENKRLIKTLSITASMIGMYSALDKIQELRLLNEKIGRMGHV